MEKFRLLIAMLFLPKGYDIDWKFTPNGEKTITLSANEYRVLL